MNWHHNLRRSETLASQLQCTVAYVRASYPKLPGVLRLPLRYLVQGWWTWRLLEQQRPKVVLVTNPPIFAPLVVWSWSRLRGARFVIDNHSGTFLDRRWLWAIPLQRWLSRRALFSWVLNPDEYALAAGGGPGVMQLPDGVPEFSPPKEGTEAADPFTVVVVCGGWDNEPTEEILDACARLPDVRFLLTGDASGAGRELLAHASRNVELTGYLRGDAYTRCLRESDAAIVLSLRNDLSAGAFECLGMGLPMVLADWPNPRQHFGGAAVFVHPSGPAIAEAVEAIRENYADMRRSVEAVRERRRQEWREGFSGMSAVIHDLAGAGA